MQRRFYNFGAPVTAVQAKNLNRITFAAGKLYGADLVIQSATSFNISPHAVAFGSGVILEETETKTLTVDTAAGAQTYSLVYDHTDVDLIGGAAATLSLQTGYIESGETKAVLLWIDYPGGGVPLSTGMFFNAPSFRVGKNPTVAAGMETTSTFLRTRSSSIAPASVSPWADIAIPAGAPYTVTLDSADVLLSDGPPNEASPTGNLRLQEKSTGLTFTEVTGAPSAGEFALDYDSRELTFNATDANKTLTGVDLTYGTDGQYFDNTTPGALLDEFVATFNSGDLPPKQLLFQISTVRGNDPSMVVSEVRDNTGALVSTEALDIETDGAIQFFRFRFLDGDFTPGQKFTVVFRVTVPASSSYFLISASMTPFDQPFTLT